MNAVWKGHPVTARGIADRLRGEGLAHQSSIGGGPALRSFSEGGWAYTTIKTMLSRLASKGALAERKEGKASLYEPLLTRRKARAHALAALAADAFDGAFGSLMHFLIEEEKLSPPERRKLLVTAKQMSQQLSPRSPRRTRRKAKEIKSF